MPDQVAVECRTLAIGIGNEARQWVRPKLRQSLAAPGHRTPRPEWRRYPL